MLGRRILAELEACDPLAPLAIEGLTFELIAEIGRDRQSRGERIPRWLASVREEIHDRFRSRLTIAALASRHQVHPVHLARRFSAAYGCAPAEYVRRLRLRWSIEALADIRNSIASVAEEAGYADQGHFTRAFKRATGMTPARYRARR
jgi:AraC-like DNA-binding protein